MKNHCLSILSIENINNLHIILFFLLFAIIIIYCVYISKYIEKHYDEDKNTAPNNEQSDKDS